MFKQPDKSVSMITPLKITRKLPLVKLLHFEKPNTPTSGRTGVRLVNILCKD